MKSIILILLFLFSSLFGSYSFSITVDKIYNYKDYVLSRSSDERKSIFLKNFDSIVVKINGNKNILQDNFIKKEREQIDKYISKYHYKVSSNNNLQLITEYDEKMFEKIFKKTKYEFLGKNRPLTILWLTIDTGAGIKFVNHDTTPALARQIEKLVSEQALPIVLPLFDLSERTFLNLSSDAELSHSLLQKASSRYKADLILTGKILRFAGVWQGNWELLGEKNITWYEQNEALTPQLEAMVVNLRKALMESYAHVTIGASNTNFAYLNISGINSIENYSKVINYLSQIPGIYNVNISEIKENILKLELQSNLSPKLLVKNIALDNLLKKENTNDNEQDLSYRLNL